MKAGPVLAALAALSVVLLGHHQAPLAQSLPSRTAPSANVQADPATDLDQPIVVQRQNGGARIMLTFPKPVRVTWTWENRELVMRFNQPAAPLGVDSLPSRLPDIVTAATAGFDSILVQTLATMTGHVQADGHTVHVVLRFDRKALSGLPDDQAPDNADTGQGLSPSDAARLRRRLVLARAHYEAGRFPEARRTLRVLMKLDPDNTDVLALLAATEARLRQPLRAMALYSRARAADPFNADVIKARQRLALQNRPGFDFGFRVVSVQGGATQISAPVTFGPVPLGRARLSAGAETRYVEAPDVQRADGTVEDFAAYLNKFDVSTAFRLNPSIEATVALSATRRGTVGLELGAALRRSVWQWDATLALHKPYWGLLETLAGDGWRDRAVIGFRRDFQSGTSVRAQAGLNRYGLGAASYKGLAQTAAISAGMTQVIAREFGTWGLDYSLDAEYTLWRTSQGSPAFTPIPLESRESHTLLGTWAQNWREFGEVSLYAGYTIDRLNDRGFVFGGRFDAPLSARLSVSGEASRSLTRNSDQTGGATDQMGLWLRYTW